MRGLSPEALQKTRGLGACVAEQPPTALRPVTAPPGREASRLSPGTAARALVSGAAVNGTGTCDSCSEAPDSPTRGSAEGWPSLPLLRTNGVARRVRAAAGNRTSDRRGAAPGLPREPEAAGPAPTLHV